MLLLTVVTSYPNSGDARESMAGFGFESLSGATTVIRSPNFAADSSLGMVSLSGNSAAIWSGVIFGCGAAFGGAVSLSEATSVSLDRFRSEEHTSELQSP